MFKKSIDFFKFAFFAIFGQKNEVLSGILNKNDDFGRLFLTLKTQKIPVTDGIS